MAADASPSSRPHPRLYDVDWLRMLATLLVFLYHCARFFDTAEPWHIKNNQLTDAFTVPMALGGQFMMPLFFILSGISTRFALGSRPVEDFVRKRAVRLLVPLVTLGWFVLSPIQVYIEASTAQGYLAPPFRGTFRQFLPHYFEGLYGRAGYFALEGLHLWYLCWLMVFTVVALPLLLFLRSRAGRQAEAHLANSLCRPGAILLLSMTLLPPELLLAPTSFVLSWRVGDWALATYLIVLVLGLLLAKNQNLRVALQKQRRLALGLALLTLVPLLRWGPRMGDLPYGSAAYVLQWGLRTINGWLWLVTILGFGAEYLNSGHPALFLAGPAVLPFYILHQPVIVILGYLVRDWRLSILPKYLLLVGSSFLICFLLYYALVRRNRLLRFLFGMGS